MKDLAYQSGSLDGMIGIQMCPTAYTSFGRVPVVNCFFCEPDRDVPALTQCAVIFCPIRYAVTGFGELVATALGMFVGHWVFEAEIDPNHASLLKPCRNSDLFNNALPTAVGTGDYPRLAAEALTSGETWSSAGGEQPKFCVYTDRGHVLVKFTAQDDNQITERWRDLLLAEHLALITLEAGGVSAAQSLVIDIGSQRFLELERFDRVGPNGRHALLSLASLDGEFVGNATAPWPVVTSDLVKQEVITTQAHAGAALLYAFGTLIGNTDMHAGNLSFVSDRGRPYELSPAYDMLPMAFSPTTGGVIRDKVSAAHLHASVDGESWRTARELVGQYLTRLRDDTRFSEAFQTCIDALRAHLDDACQKISRLG